MAGEIKISALPLAGPAQDADVTAGVQTGVTVKQTNSALATYMKTKVDLNSAYAVTPSYTLTISSGLTVLGTSFVVANSAGSAQASAIFEIDSTTQGFLMPRMTAVQMNAISLPATGLEVFNTTGNAPYFYDGSAWVPSDGSSLTILGTTNQVNVALAGSTYTLSTPQNINITANFQSGTLGVNLASTLDPSAIFEADSTTQGMLFPRMTETQESVISSPATGLTLYNTSYDTIDYYSGTQWQNLLTTDHILQGANMIVTDNGNGTVTLASTGGGSSGTQVQGSFHSFSPTTATPVTNLDTPIAVAGGGFTPINQVGTNVALMTISGVQTPIIQNTTTAGRWVTVNYDLTLYITTNASETYSFSVFTNTGLVAFPKQMTLVGNTPFYQTFEFTTPVVYLNPGDYVYLTVSSSLSDGPTFNAYYFNGRLIDTSIAGIPSTDALPQGSNDLYLSQNGGSTYQYMSGSAVIGDLPKFNSTGGQLIDSGIAASNVIQSTTSLGGSLSGNLPNPSLSATGISQIIAITQFTGSQAMVDSAPTNRYVSELTSDATITLPTSMTIGHTLEIFGGSAGHITIGQNAGQKITTSVGGSTVSTTVGTGGSAQLSNYNDCITLVYNGAGEFVIANSQTSGAGIILN